MVYLVRHAHAGKKSAWLGPDLARPLSPEGRGQAAGLVDQLAGREVSRLLSSPAVRCLQTLRPLAARLGLPIEPVERLGVAAAGDDVLELLAGPALQRAVVCTHGEVIGKVFAELQQVGLWLSDRPRWPKGSTWALDRDGTGRWQGRFLAPRTVPSTMAAPLRWPAGGKEVAGR
jgi:broad specificity phosphatase PhoE